MCPLCKDPDSQAIDIPGEERSYLHCLCCDLRFIAKGHHLDPEEERKRYQMHAGDYEDEGYRHFVASLIKAVQERVPAGACGLDYGAGHTPVLAKWLKDLGYEMSAYDSFFWPRPELLLKHYDFIVACEVIEHFFHPSQEFSRLVQMVKPGGTLVLKTHLVTEAIDFGDWYYRRDPTHVVFYSPVTMAWIASRHQLDLVHLEERLIVFAKS